MKRYKKCGIPVPNIQTQTGVVRQDFGNQGLPNDNIRNLHEIKAT